MAGEYIYIADDDTNIREAIKTFLESENYNVTAFENGDALLEQFNEKPSDLVILDIMMPGTDGFGVCKEIRKNSIAPIIMLTARDSEIDYATGMTLGSDDYFTKPFSPMSLVLRVKSIFRRIEFEHQADKIDAESEAIFADVIVDEKNKVARIKDEEIALTPNEYELLLYLVRHSDRAVSRDELLEEVWGFNTEVETRATDDTIRRLRKKIENSRVVIDAVRGFGFRLKDVGEKSHEK